MEEERGEGGGREVDDDGGRMKERSGSGQGWRGRERKMAVKGLVSNPQD